MGFMAFIVFLTPLSTIV